MTPLHIHRKPRCQHKPHDVLDIDTMPIPIPHANAPIPNILPNANPAYFTAKDLGKIYGFPPVNTSVSNVIGVLSFGGGLYGTLTKNILTNGDVQKYWAFLGIPVNQMPKVIVYLVGGAINDVANDATLENTLDVSIIGACCPNPNLTIILYIFPNTYLFTQSLPIALGGVTLLNVLYKPSILSISWGLSEEYIINTQEAINVYNILKIATDSGINICVASGDNGSTDGSTSGLLYTDFPSSCPFVTAVGGTSLECPNIVYDSQTVETVWNNGSSGSGGSGDVSATGGGISRIYKKPDYQSTITSSSATSLLNTTMRSVPDIALDADPNTGIVIYLNNKLVGKYGGTSISAPLFASYLILINAKTFINPLLYSIFNTNISCFHDITVGSNADNTSGGSGSGVVSYQATSGYDWCSGLGSIVGDLLTTTLNNNKLFLPPLPQPPHPSIQLASSITISPTTYSLTINKTLQAIATVLPLNTANKTVKWTSSNIRIATVSNTGLITAVGIGLGPVIITGTTTDGSLLSASININIIPVIKASSINITIPINSPIPIPIPITIPLSQSYQFTATILPSNTTNQTIMWSSNNNNIITINSSGLAKGKNKGNTFINAMTSDGSNKISTIKIKVI